MTLATTPAQPLSEAERQRYFDAIYKRTHPDFKGQINGTKTLIRYAKYGSGLTALQGMCDAELRERYADTKR